MPVALNIWIGKLLLWASRRFGPGGGSALPGLVAETLDPELLGKLGGRFKSGVIIVTGTNGKTTTTKMLAAILEASGQTVLTNRSGSNLTRGLVSTLIEHANWSGKLDYDCAVFEVDEATMPAACDQLRPRAVVVLNLFRDQLDRYGELDTTAALIGRGIESLTGAKIFLNADDPLVASLASYAGKSSVSYFGVEDPGLKKLPHDLAADSNHCPLCGLALRYTENFFSHLGHYRCPNGHFDRPEADFKLQRITARGPFASRLKVSAGSEAVEFDLPLPGLYNAYNALAALAVGSSYEPILERAGSILARTEAAFGRVEKVELGGRQVYLLLIKNPTGFNQVIQTFLAGSPPRNLLIAINDNFADGRDVSWLWDAAVEDMGQHEVVTSGLRAADMALRLKYAEMAAAVEPDLRSAVKQVVTATKKGQTAYILPTYTAMLELRRLIAEEAGLEGFWR